MQTFETQMKTEYTEYSKLGTDDVKVNQKNLVVVFPFVIHSVVKRHFSDYTCELLEMKNAENTLSECTVGLLNGGSFTEKCVIKGMLVSRMNFQKKCDKKRLVMYVNAPSENHFERYSMYVSIRNLYLRPVRELELLLV